MVVGDGMIASAFIKAGADNWPCIIFASGVSNSMETEHSEYLKEENLLNSYSDLNQRLVYFSTVSVFDPSLAGNPYILHKLKLEQIIEDKFKSFLIVRLPIVVGRSTNKHTLTNFLYNSLVRGDKFYIYQNASRYLLDLDDVVRLTSILIEKTTSNQKINLVFDDKVSVIEIVEILKKISGKNGNYEIIPAGSDYKIDNSLANTVIQLKILEAYNMIRKSKPEAQQKRKIGKPKIMYELSQEIIFAGILKQGIAEKKIIKQPDSFQQIMYNSIFLMAPEEQYCLLKFLLETEIIKKIQSLSFLRSNEREIELFVMTEHVAEFREKYSNYTVEPVAGKTKKIISWSHNKKEVEEGLSRGEEYFKELLAGQLLFEKVG